MSLRSDAWFSGKRLADQANAWANEGKRVMIYLRGRAEPFAADTLKLEGFTVELGSKRGDLPIVVAIDSIDAVTIME